MQVCCGDQTFVTVLLLLGNRGYLPDVIKFQCSLAALFSDECVQSSRSGSQDCRHSVCDQIWICKNRSNPGTTGEKGIHKNQVLSSSRKPCFSRKMKCHLTHTVQQRIHCFFFTYKCLTRPLQLPVSVLHATTSLCSSWLMSKGAWLTVCWSFRHLHLLTCSYNEVKCASWRFSLRSWLVIGYVIGGKLWSISRLPRKTDGQDFHNWMSDNSI